MNEWLRFSMDGSTRRKTVRPPLFTLIDTDLSVTVLALHVVNWAQLCNQTSWDIAHKLGSSCTNLKLIIL